MLLERVAIAILAGGHGSRLWPLSRPERPKQFIPLLPEGSMLQATYARAARIVPEANVLIVGNRQHREKYREQVPGLRDENLVLEPAGLGTAPCISLTAVREAVLGRFDVVVSVPADHIIANSEEWEAAVEVGAQYAASNDALVSIAAIPDAAENKFGYLVTEDRLGGTDRCPVSRVVRFVEKPAAELLTSLLESGHCIRNMGMLAFRPEVLLSEVERHAPGIVAPLRAAADQEFDEASLDAAYRVIPQTSIDVAVLQETSKLVAVTSRIKSVDAGDFVSLGNVLERDENGNALKGRTVLVDAQSNTILAGDATVAAVGVSDLIIVVEEDIVLVCPKDKSQRIKEAADQ